VNIILKQAFQKAETGKEPLERIYRPEVKATKEAN
jgi:hypothetical protein